LGRGAVQYGMGVLKTVLSKECKKLKCTNPEHVKESLKYREMLYAHVEKTEGIKKANELDKNGVMDSEILRRHMKEHENAKKAVALKKFNAAVAKAENNPAIKKTLDMERMKHMNENYIAEHPRDETK
jgi:hypothetical protein